MGVIKEILDNRSALTAEAKALCRNPDDAEDLTMRTIERAIAKKDTFSVDKGEVIDWLKAIMRNIRKDDLSLKAANAVTSTEEEDLVAIGGVDNSTEEEIFRNSDGEFIRKVVDSLSKEQREAVVMHYFLDLPIIEVARILKVPVGTVKTRLHYARKVLEVKFTEEMKKPRAMAILALLFLSAVTYAAIISGALSGLFAGNGSDNTTRHQVPAERTILVTNAQPAMVATSTNSVESATEPVTNVVNELEPRERKPTMMSIQ